MSDPEPQTRSDESRRFEAGLRRLLQSYSPPAPREAFREDLFDRLKARQAELAVGRRRRRTIRRLSYAAGATALAASVLLVFGVGITVPEPQAAPSAPGEFRTATADAAPAGRVVGVVDANAADGQTRRIRRSLPLDRPVRVRAQEEQAGLEIAPGVSLVMEKGSSVVIDGDTVRVDCGLISLRSRADAAAIAVALPHHDIELQPGSWLGLEVEDPAEYAAGGTPAPDVTLMEGNARLLARGQQRKLQPGRTYRLHNYPRLDYLPGETLDEKRLRNAGAWVKPTLVNFQTVVHER
jgi:hypothetical protein